jgi:hypothetical protein
VVRTTILDDTTSAKSAAQGWAREKEAQIDAGVLMLWTDRSRSDAGRVGAAAAFNYGNECRSHGSFLGTARMEVFDSALWAMGLALHVTTETRETLQKHGVKTVAVFSDSQAAIRRAAHMVLRQGHRLVRRINRRVRSLLAHGICNRDPQGPVALRHPRK